MSPNANFDGAATPPVLLDRGRVAGIRLLLDDAQRELSCDDFDILVRTLRRALEPETSHSSWAVCVTLPERICAYLRPIELLMTFHLPGRPLSDDRRRALAGELGRVPLESAA